jgi:hypothetical protein
MLQRLMDEYRRETGKEPIEDIFRAALLIVDMHANEQIMETLVGGMTAH